MRSLALQVDHVSKRFRRGELHDSLRDLLPAITRKLIGARPRPSTDKREFWALQDVCFEVERGEAFGIIGSNGAGKSTMLKLLCGIMTPSSGVLKVNGRMSALIEVSAGFHPDLTGRENIFLNGTILGLSRKEISRRFDEIVAFSGLEEFLDTPVKRYSSGMYARLGFSVAAHVDPDILIVDEVLSVGDFAFQRRCLERMTAVLKGGATVIFVSHNLEAVANLCTRTLLLDRGRVVKIGASEEVVREYLGTGSPRRADDLGQEAFISRVQIRGRDGPRNHFQAGEKAFIDIEVRANSACERLAVFVGINTREVAVVFNTSTERLGAKTISLHAGAKVTCTFALDLHLAAGTYFLSASIFRYDIEKCYDEWESAQTFFVSADRDMRGVANLYPEVSIGGVGVMEAGRVEERAQP
jgi:lipopolysaccharide transport system ATP-binding protein